MLLNISDRYDFVLDVVRVGCVYGDIGEVEEHAAALALLGWCPKKKGARPAWMALP